MSFEALVTFSNPRTYFEFHGGKLFHLLGVCCDQGRQLATEETMTHCWCEAGKLSFTWNGNDSNMFLAKSIS